MDKGKALLALAGILGLERAQVMACGDSSNDVAMLRAYTSWERRTTRWVGS